MNIYYFFPTISSDSTIFYFALYHPNLLHSTSVAFFFFWLHKHSHDWLCAFSFSLSILTFYAVYLALLYSNQINAIYLARQR